MQCEAEAMFPSLPAPTVMVVWNIKVKLRPSIFHTSFCKQQMNKLYHESGHNLCISISPWPISLLFWMVRGADVWVCEPSMCGGWPYTCMWVYLCPACVRVCPFSLVSGCTHVCSVSAGLGVYSSRINESSAVPLLWKRATLIHLPARHLLCLWPLSLP